MVSNRQESGCPRATRKWWLPHSKVTCLLCTEMLTVALHWAVACRTQESLIQKLCGQGAAIDIPVDPEIRGDGTQEGVFPTQEGHGEDRWAWAMELWTEVCGPKGQGAKSDRGISREWSTALWVPEGQTSLRAGDGDEGQVTKDHQPPLRSTEWSRKPKEPLGALSRG